MRLICLFVNEDSDSDTAWLADAVDEYTVDSLGELPELYIEKKKKYGAKARELIVEIPDSAVEKLFQAPVVKGKVD